MSFSRLNLRPLAWCAALLAIAAGCRPQDQIAKYTVPKPELIDPTLASTSPAEARPQQMLGAIVLLPEAGWFFKLTGDPVEVGKVSEPFIDFVTSVKFTQGRTPEPQWVLPEGWKALPGNDFRFATIEIRASDAASKPLELAVSSLGMSAADQADSQNYILKNVNRWRGQLGLREIELAELATETKVIDVDGRPCTLVNIKGQATGSGMMAGPFAGGGGSFAGGGMPPGQATDQGSQQAEAKLDFTTPDGWTPIPPRTFGLAAFSVGEGEKQAEITVSSAGGELLANVNRWRGQIGLPPVSDAGLAEITKQTDTLGVKGSLVELVGPEKTILGVAATAGGNQYFVKLTGDNETAQAQKANFEAFVKSLQLK
jgi:hypothetical protein